MLYNIPGQTVKGWLNDLETVVEMQPDHIAMYSLTTEEGTPFYTDIQNGHLPLPENPIECEMFIQGSRYLRDCGFNQYEISHFANKGMECLQNIHYWKRDPYLAFGPSAHGFDGEKRYWNVASLEKYSEILSQNNLPIQDSEILSSEDILNEIVINGLRTNLGIPTSCFDNLGDISIQKWESYLERVNGSLILKPEYFHLADEIAADLMIW
jgi:oxygen-independent coproporphyrinogen-3 oxidase